MNFIEMECTQRLECTQDLYSHSQNERLLPEQIGFLGICGTKYPVKKGPNKIGRDPQTCNIVLKLHSVSRQHAVINILNKNDFKLMDLDSANKTKLAGVTLKPYIPHPLRNGDTVQFGEIFGIFRLLEEETDLPMTQALDIPDTPVQTKHLSRVNIVTTIPESPDVSDKDDSFIVPSQPKGQQFQSSKTHNFIKPGRTISIQPVGTNKIDNVYWNSSKKSTSLNLDDSTSRLDDSIVPVKSTEKEDVVINIHELETQEVFPPQNVHNDSTDSIYTAETQLPNLDNLGPSIYTANTQMPDATSSPSIHSLDTQLPCGMRTPDINNLDTQVPDALAPVSIHSLDTQLPRDDNLPEGSKINKQQDMHIDLCANKENDDSIYNAETQIFTMKNDNVLTVLNNINDSPTRIKPNKLSISNDDILFDEVDNQQFGDFESQAMLAEDIDLPINRLVEPDNESESQSQIVGPKSAKRNMRIKSDSSTDCEDVDKEPIQKIKEKEVIFDDDNTDCEEEVIELKINNNEISKACLSKSVENFEEMATQVIVVNETPSKTNKDLDFEDMPTQVILIDDVEKDAIAEGDKSNVDINFEDLPTQVLQNHSHRLCKDTDSPFKVPFNSPWKGKKKDVSKITDNNPRSEVHDRYYQNTEDIYEDLCTQKIDLPEVVPEKTVINWSNVKSVDQVDAKSPRPVRSPNKSLSDTALNSVDAAVNDFVSNLSSQDVRDLIGVDKQVAPLQKVPSDGSTASDVEITPKKQRPFKFSEIDLPDSQEIKKIVSLTTSNNITESSSESDPEVNSEEQCTPILFRKKKKLKSVTKLDLTKKLEVQALPSRVLTRVRKPTSKLQELQSNKSPDNILKPKFMSEQEGVINNDIITENITRLKSKFEKPKNVKNNTEPDKEIKQTVISKETKQVGSNKEINQPSISKETKQVESSKEIKQPSTTRQTKQVESNKELKQLSTSDNTKQVGSNKEIKQPVTFGETRQVGPHKEINHAVISKETNQVSLRKETIQVNVVKETIADKMKKQIISRKKVLDDKEEVEKKSTEREKSSYKESKPKREPKINKTESTDSKKSTTMNSTKQSLDSIAESKDKTNSYNKSKEIHSFDLTELTDKTKRSTRSTRTVKNMNKLTETENKSASTERDSQTEKPNKRKYTRKQEPKEAKEPSREKEVRRSKRQRTAKETKEEPVKVIKSILKNSVPGPHEESAVYNVSSNSDSCRSFKRPALDDSDAPNSKRTRSLVANNTSLRATPARKLKTQYVLFTAFPFEAVKAKLEKMGAVVVSDLMKSTVVLTQQIKRTFKLLCAVGLGKPIVGPNWVQACADTNMIVDPWLYLMKDEAAEKRFHFSLERTLRGNRQFLEGYNLSSTPRVMPEPHEMKLIVECSGGTWNEGGAQWICVTCPDDKALWPALRARGAVLVSTEFILGGVLRQRVDIDANKYKI